MAEREQPPSACDPIKENEAAIKKWEEDEAYAKTLVRFNEHFQARARRENNIANAALVLGGGLSLAFTKQRPHNLACGALSYMAAKQILAMVDGRNGVGEERRRDLFALT